mgnify:CR=1 FL=1
MKRLLLTLLPAAAWAQEKPNVIWLMADDLGYGDISCYGATRVQTPNIDRVASQGVRFTDMHACASTSTPSRYGILTGEYPFCHPGTDVAAGNAGTIIWPQQYTMADMMRSAGYRTGAFGKWHLGLGSRTGEQDWNGKLDVGLDSLGFDYSYIMAATSDRVPCVFIEQGRIANYDPSAPVQVSYRKNFEGEPTGRTHPELLTKLRPSHGHDMSIVNGISRIGYMKGGGRALWRDEDIADSITAHAVRFMNECSASGSPFFMYLCTNDIHVPRMPHERFRGRSPMGLRGEAILAVSTRPDGLGPACVVHRHAHRKHVLGLYHTPYSIRIRFKHPEILEFREVLRYGIVKVESAILDKRRHRDAAEALGLGTLHIHVIKRDLALRLHVGVSNAGGLLDPIVVQDADCARQ